MSRYHALAEHLKWHEGSAWDASFEEIEKILGSPLPKSAYTYPAWWANQSGPGHSQTNGWKSVGWRTTRLDLPQRRVRFERSPASMPAAASSDDQLFDDARKWTGIEDRTRLIEEGLKALIAREAASRLVKLGGSMPDYSPPPRERQP